ncbi:MAG: pro-sigmaK processing inhibitor BofA family protein [Bacilli bacterium]|nr:pro-sigmaK processing inhibitor BofA family protein [Bacilli bacterium]
MNYLTMVLVAVIVLLLAKFVLNLNLRRIIELAINIVLGILVLWLLNKFGGSLGISIPINVITAIVVGVLGIPGVIILVLLNLIGII